MVNPCIIAYQWNICKLCNRRHGFIIVGGTKASGCDDHIGQFRQPSELGNNHTRIIGNSAMDWEANARTLRTLPRYGGSVGIHRLPNQELIANG